MGDGDGAPNGVGAAVVPKGDADDNPPVAPNGLPLFALGVEFPNGVGAWAEGLPKGVDEFCEVEVANGDWVDGWNIPDLDPAFSPELAPKGDELGAGFPKGDDDAVVFC